jgi:hypothetical protein
MGRGAELAKEVCGHLERGICDECFSVTVYSILLAASHGCKINVEVPPWVFDLFSRRGLAVPDTVTLWTSWPQREGAR